METYAITVDTLLFNGGNGKWNGRFNWMKTQGSVFVGARTDIESAWRFWRMHCAWETPMQHLESSVC